MAPTVYTPPVNTYIPIGSVTLSATASEVVFSSLPTSGYRDLILIWSGTSTSGTDIVVSCNGDTTNSYPNVQMFGTGSSAISSAFTRTGAFFTYSSTSQNDAIVQIMDYSASDKHTTILSRGNANEVSATASRYPQTNVVSSISVRSTSNPMAIGSTLSLYAIAG